jgi:tetratricopeptide (TPR) repeat protein
LTPATQPLGPKEKTMNESANTIIEALKIVTDFLSNNSKTLVLLALLIICRDAISNFISRLTSLSFKNGDSTLGIEAASPSDGKDNTKELPSPDEEPSSEEKDSQVEKVERKEGEWFSIMHSAFEEKRFDDAEAIFKKYAVDEKDEVELEKNKTVYLYFRFEKAKDNKAIEELKDLARTAKTEESKFIILEWLSFCFRDSMQYGKEIELWRSALDEIESESLKTRAIVNLAYVLNKEDKSTEAKKLIIERLPSTVDDTQKSRLYEALSKIEQTLGNKSLSIYCKDKSLEFDANNRDELFNSAYAASNEDIDEISISNYIKLIGIDEDNSTALNNLGARAQEAGLKIKAVENYKKSAGYNNTLAMANQGYLLLDAGFTDEAENIARQALKFADPHQNVHSLIAAINEQKQEQTKEWNKLQEKSLNRQKDIRNYTEQYYLGNPELLKGDWLVSNTYPTTIKIEKNVIKATWAESVGLLGGGVSYTVGLEGKVSGSTFEGKYTRKKDDNSPNTLLGFGENPIQSCIGYISDDGNKFKLISTELKNNFSLSFSRPKA